MRTKREAAHFAARLGFDVIPITPNAKKPPLLKNWQNLGTQDPKQIDAWWGLWRNANLGAVVSDKLVFDIDPRHGGWDTWNALRAIEHFPNTLCSTTAGGGAHVIYQMPEGQKVKKGTHKAGPGVDVLGSGAYIVLPGSTIDDRRYEWDNNTPIAFAPEWAIERYKNATERTAAAGKRVVEEDDIAIELATKWMRNRAPCAEYGKIDDTTYEVAVELYDYGVSVPTATEIMLEWNETKCSPPGDIERLYVVTESASRSRENPIGCKHPLAPGFDVVEIAERAPAAVLAIATTRERLYTIRADESARIALERRGEPLIHGIIDRGTMSVLVGKGGGGKTFLALDWAYHLAKGREWAGRRVKQGPVVYLAAEAGNMFHSRVRALEKHYGPLGDAPLYIIPCPANFSRGPEDVKAILALIRDVENACGQKVELFVVDTLARVMTGDENSTQDMGVIIEAVDFIRQQVGCHGMLIHHPNKAGTSARGSGNVFGAIDTEMWIDNKVLSFTKQRDLPEGADIRFKLVPLHIGEDADGAPITSCVVRVPKPGESEPKVDLPPRLVEVWGSLCAALAAAKKTSFDLKFLRAISLRQSSVNSIPDTTIKTWMTELTESGYLRKGVWGQWVTVTDETDETDENTKCKLTTDSPTPVRRGDRQTPRAKRRTK